MSPPAPLIRADFPANCIDFLLGAARMPAILRPTGPQAESFAQFVDAAMARDALIAY
jgi:hypothetical protein